MMPARNICLFLDPISEGFGEEFLQPFFPIPFILLTLHEKANRYVLEIYFPIPFIYIKNYGLVV